MTIANCPRCCEQVSVPVNASREATVQCPLCSEEYSLDEALSKLPPTLVVLSDPDAIEPTQAPASLLSDENDTPWDSLTVDSTDDDDDVTLAPIDDSPAAPFDFAGASTDGGGKPTASIRPSTRSRKPKGSPIKSVLSIVIGGLMAFPIAQLILWYLPGDLKRDFGAGPIVAQYIPAIVPAKFRGNAGTDSSSSNPSGQTSDSSIPDFNFGGDGEFAGDGAAQTPVNNSRKKKRNTPKSQSGFPEFDDNNTPEEMNVDDAVAAGADIFGGDVELPAFDANSLPDFEPATEPEPQPETDPIAAPMTEPALAIDSPLEAFDPPSPKPMPSDVPTSLPPFDESTTLDNSPPAEVSGLATGAIRNSISVDADQVATSFRNALEGNLAWDTDAAGSPSNALKLKFYASFSKLGEALTFADEKDASVIEQIEETDRLLQEIAKQPDKLSVVSGVATNWVAWGNEKRGTNGICVFGTVKSVNPSGELFETVIETKGDPIAIVSTSDPSQHFVPGGEVLVVGTIIEDPAKNLGGYKGDQKVVVFDGYHVAVAKE